MVPDNPEVTEPSWEPQSLTALAVAAETRPRRLKESPGSPGIEGIPPAPLPPSEGNMALYGPERGGHLLVVVLVRNRRLSGQL